MPETIYNPLLKKGFQELSDTSQIERNVTQLQNDVTRIDTNLTELQQSAAIKVYSTSALASLTVGAIFQWQGETTTTAPILTKGYFYEKTASDTYAQLDTQPRLQNVTNGNGGSVEISTNTRIAGDLTVSGTSTTVHAQQVESENDYITLRKNNPLGLANGDYSGMEIDNYDGNNTNLKLVVGNDGWARVGDSGGTLQKLATIQENPTNGQFVKYNTTTKELESSPIDYSNVANTPGAATPSAAGLMSAADKTKLNGIAENANNYSLPTASAQTKGGVKVGDGLRITNEVLSVTDSAANKVTKVSTAAELDNLEDGELFQWQGADTDQFKYGYFYKLSITTQTVPAGTQYFEYPTGFPPIELNGYTFAPGKYYLVQDNTPSVSSNFSNFYVVQYRPNTDLYTVSENDTLTVGQKFYNKNTSSYITVTGINDHTLTFSDGTSFTYEYVASSSFNNLFRIIAENGDIFDMITSGMGALICHYTLSGNVFNLIDWFRIQEPILRTLADAITVRVTSYTQTDTQPAPTDGSALDINFTDASVSGNIASGETLAVMMKKISQYFIVVDIFLSPTSGESHSDGFKRMIAQLTTLYPTLSKTTGFLIYFTFYNKIIVRGGAYNTNNYANVDGHYKYCNFTAIRLLGDTNIIYQFGWSGTNWYYREI